ncbi:isoquinoline 1-oxidoreductase beta subunit [Sphingomonas vulcanisoli]|uniref:Isoquinoline 1-oxidoreductase beta subunit n=1 Tax=Sphingomonas vulcanisoli TaxID=1658060 RepID=A0ABX0TWG4_9SPHN|nr:molybdopterin cofactor-binding domain-containing protein [Sphingomonas vulcanisoli]NIJ08780.1 isoquinoline 1-oxidoreductase beta subunit [Sphingomonas vulcanisoli]
MIADPPHRLSRRSILIGGGAGAGLILAWGLWPRAYAPNLAAAPGETVLNAFLKIGEDGHVTVVVPQIEMGQGVWTALPQILADELGADWRQIAVEPAPIGPLYANRLLAEEAEINRWPAFLGGVGRWATHEFATRESLMVTAGSTSIRAFEQRFRDAGATARALLCMAAGKRIGADWRACDTAQGFVVRGNDKLRFGDLAADAAGFAPPSPPPLRKPGEGGLSGQALPRLDLPAKVDGSTRYAGDVRLPGIVFASIRHGPLGETRLAGSDKAKAEQVPGVIAVIEDPAWIAVLANTWWAADRALDVIAPRFATDGALPDAALVDKALDAALAGGGKTLFSQGGAIGTPTLTADYAVPLAAHAAIEPLVAAAHVNGDRLEVWVPTQAPSLTRAAVAAATGMSTGRVTVYPMQVGGGFGRKIENDAAIEAAVLAVRSKRPVSLMWSRAEEMQRAPHRPPAKAKLSARLEGQRITGWQAVIAAPATMGELEQRLIGRGGSGAEHAAIEGALPPYAIPAVSLAHAPADIDIATGLWKAMAHSYTCFFTESFIDELAAKSGADPLSFRMTQLGQAPRLARCLTRVPAIGGWSGEAGAGQGIAVHSAFGSHVAVLAEAAAEGDAVKVSKLTAAIDCGRVINPDIVRQQIEGGLIWGMAAALGDAVSYTRGVIDQRTLKDLALPLLADCPEITVEIIPSGEAPGGVAELGVPAVAPAIANAIASATGKRLRSLPLRLG